MDGKEFPDVVLLRTLCEALVDYPNEIVINRSIDDLGVLVTLQVEKNDMGKVIGKSGVCAQAIRTILRSVGMKHGAKVNLKILEPATAGQTVMRDAMKDVHDALAA